MTRLHPYSVNTQQIGVLSLVMAAAVALASILTTRSHLLKAGNRNIILLRRIAYNLNNALEALFLFLPLHALGIAPLHNARGCCN
ncbi:hypothetical protein BDV11DRAFT_34518 [Aspergillus similis]